MVVWRSAANDDEDDDGGVDNDDSDSAPHADNVDNDQIVMMMVVLIMMIRMIMIMTMMMSSARDGTPRACCFGAREGRDCARGLRLDATIAARQRCDGRATEWGRGPRRGCWNGPRRWRRWRRGPRAGRGLRRGPRRWLLIWCDAARLRARAPHRAIARLLELCSSARFSPPLCIRAPVVAAPRCGAPLAGRRGAPLPVCRHPNCLLDQFKHGQNRLVVPVGPAGL